MSIADIVEGLYEPQPQTALYHYTTLQSLLGIVKDAALRATDLRFLNDATELDHVIALLNRCIQSRQSRDAVARTLLQQFEQWLRHRLSHGHLVFVVCFSADGNQLNQWRGYARSGKGVSVGFEADRLTAVASHQSFRLARCVHAPDDQKIIGERFIDDLVKLGRLRGESAEDSTRNRHESYYDVFEEVEDDLLRVAALLKDNAYRDEQEWRAVSHIVANYTAEAVEYREGESMLVPFTRFALPKAVDRRIDIEKVIVGPHTPFERIGCRAQQLLVAQRRRSPAGNVLLPDPVSLSPAAADDCGRPARWPSMFRERYPARGALELCDAVGAVMRYAASPDAKKEHA